MADYKAFRDAIAGVIQAEAPNSGNVHHYERNLFDWNKYLAEFVSTIQGKRQTRGWWVTRERRIHDNDSARDSGAAFGQYNAEHQFVVRGILGVQDAADTDAVFGDLCDDVIEAMESMAITGAWNIGPCVLRVQEPRQFGSVLCHYAEILVPVQKVYAR